LTRAFRIVPVVAPTRDVADLLSRHADLMRAETPAESCHAMDAEALFASGASIFAARMDTTILGIAAVKRLDAAHGEIKSMHTRSDARGLGVGAALLQRVVTEARALGLQRLSLETGSSDMFGPARRLYERHGFSCCGPFADYTHDPLSVFMTRRL